MLVFINAYLYHLYCLTLIPFLIFRSSIFIRLIDKIDGKYIYGKTSRINTIDLYRRI